MNSVQGYRGFITFLILAGIVLTTFIGFRIISQPTNIVSRASVKEIVPVAIADSDTTDTTTSIKWSTEVATVGSVKYSTEEGLCEAGDASKCNELNEGTSNSEHIVNISNLSPETKYFYKVKNGSKYYPEGQALTFTTQKKINALTNESNPVSKTETPESESKAKPSDDQQDDFDGFSTQTTFSTENVTPEVFANENPSITNTVNSNSESDFDGFGETNPGESNVLGIKTNSIEQEFMGIFDEALKNNDLNYDFKKDGKVDNLDYPLFVEFITNPED